MLKFYIIPRRALNKSKGLYVYEQNKIIMKCENQNFIKKNPMKIIKKKNLLLQLCKLTPSSRRNSKKLLRIKQT